MSSNLFGSGGGGGVGGLSPRPSINDTFGLRQRNNVHSSKLSASDNNKSNIETENSHPNNHNTLSNSKKNSVQTFGKWGSSISNVRAPPRMSLASCGGKKYGTPNRNNVASAGNSNQKHQQKTSNIEKTNDRTANQSSAIIETPNYISSTRILEYKSKIRTEADIMLYPDEYDEVYTTNGRSTLDSICERVLGWFFFWPN